MAKSEALNPKYETNSNNQVTITKQVTNTKLQKEALQTLPEVLLDLTELENPSQSPFARKGRSN